MVLLIFRGRGREQGVEEGVDLPAASGDGCATEGEAALAFAASSGLSATNTTNFPVAKALGSTAVAFAPALTGGNGPGMKVAGASNARPAAALSAATASPPPSAANLLKARAIRPWFPGPRGATATAETVGLRARTAPLGTLATRSLYASSSVSASERGGLAALPKPAASRAAASPPKASSRVALVQASQPELSWNSHVPVMAAFSRVVTKLVQTQGSSEAVEAATEEATRAISAGSVAAAACCCCCAEARGGRRRGRGSRGRKGRRRRHSEGASRSWSSFGGRIFASGKRRGEGRSGAEGEVEREREREDEKGRTSERATDAFEAL